MRKIKIAILLAVVILILPVTLLSTAMGDSKEGDNICSDESAFSNLYVKVNITAKRGYDKGSTKYQFPRFEQGDTLFVNSLNINNTNNCIIYLPYIYIPVISPTTGERKDWGLYNLSIKLKPRESRVVVFNYTPREMETSSFGGTLLNELGTWRIRPMGIVFIDGPEYNNTKTSIECYDIYLREYQFQVETKTTLEILDLTKALADSSIESANAAKETRDCHGLLLIL